MINDRHFLGVNLAVQHSIEKGGLQSSVDPLAPRYHPVALGSIPKDDMYGSLICIV